MAADNSYTIRSAGSVEEILTLWWPLMKELEWNRDPDDAITHCHASRDGKDWHVIIPKGSDKPEGCVVGFTYPNATGWVGFFCVNAPFRGHGLGRALFKEAELSFKASGTEFVGLDGVREQHDTYARRGFQHTGWIYFMMRPSLKQKSLTAAQSQAVSVEGDLRDLKSVDPKLLVKLDLECTGFDRRAYWSHDGLLSRKDAFGYVLSVPSDSTSLRGLLLVRRCQHGHRFGPLYAETYADGLRLLYVAMNRISESDGNMVAEIFGNNPNGRKLFEDMGWTFAGVDFHRMWLNGKVPEAQREDGKGSKYMYATFDACAG